MRHKGDTDDFTQSTQRARPVRRDGRQPCSAASGVQPGQASICHDRVQKITNNNTLDIWNEQSNVGERVFFPNLWEGLIMRDWMGNQGPVPGLATEWKRIDDKTVELKLRQGVKFHNGDETDGRRRRLQLLGAARVRQYPAAGGKTIFEDRPQAGDGQGTAGCRPGRWPPPVARAAGVEAVDKYTVRFHNATPDVTMEGRLYAFGSPDRQPSRLGRSCHLHRLGRKPVTTGAYMVGEFKPDVSLTLVALTNIGAAVRRSTASASSKFRKSPRRVNGLLSGEYDFACDLPPDQIAAVQAARASKSRLDDLNHRITVFNTQNEILPIRWCAAP
jgi:peptide/nickel transport system substrate-binding protein